MTNQAEARLHQLDLLNDLGHSLDRYTHSTMEKSIFNSLRGCFEAGYIFRGEGFATMTPLQSAEVFIGTFAQGERNLINRIYADKLDPFSRKQDPLFILHAYHD